MAMRVVATAVAEDVLAGLEAAAAGAGRVLGPGEYEAIVIFSGVRVARAALQDEAESPRRRRPLPCRLMLRRVRQIY